MIPRFTLARPETLDDAFAAFAGCGGDGAYFAGGTELLQVMKMGFAQFGTLIDLKRIAELGGIDLEPDGSLRIGATVTHRQIERSDVVAKSLPALVGLERRVANVRVRNTGTIGGNLAFAEPHSDPATLLLACGASLDLASPDRHRTLDLEAFVLGPLTTAREPEEVLVSIRVPPALGGEGRAYEKIAFFERPAASVAVSVRVEDGRIREARVAVGSLTERPALVAEAAAALVGAPAEPSALDEPIARATDALRAIDVIADHNGDADYKRHLAGVLLGRAARTALREAMNGA